MRKKHIVAMVGGIAVALSIIGSASAMVAPRVKAPVMKAPVATSPIVATFDVAGERFKVRFTKAADIALARKVLGNKVTPAPFPMGKIVYGSPEVNTGYTWHLVDVSWVDSATEVCDGRPRSDVESHHLTSPYYCPWDAKLISVK